MYLVCLASLSISNMEVDKTGHWIQYHCAPITLVFAHGHQFGGGGNTAWSKRKEGATQATMNVKF